MLFSRMGKILSCLIPWKSFMLMWQCTNEARHCNIAFAPLTIVIDGCFSNLRRSRCHPKIPPELHDAFISAIIRGNIRTIPNNSMPADPYPTPGALLMGDAFNMCHPLTGGSMTVALSDIVVLRYLLKPLYDLNDGASLCRYLESFYTLQPVAGALYKVFSASPYQARKELRQACFDYLSLGTTFSTGPMGLLSGLNPCPLSLVLHFFAVAINGVGRLLLPFPSFKRMWIGARLILCASGIIFPIVRAEGVRQMFFPATLPAFYRSPLICLSLNWIKTILTVGPKEWRTSPRNGQIMSFISKE